MKMLSLLTALLTVLVVTLSACSMTPSDASNAELRTTVQLGLLSVVGDDEDQAQNILDAVHAAQANLRHVEEPVPLAEVKDVLTSHINWTQMSPHQQLLVNDMINLAMLYVEDDIGSGLLNEEQVIYASEILGWIETSMQIILEDGGGSGD